MWDVLQEIEQQRADAWWRTWNDGAALVNGAVPPAAVTCFRAPQAQCFPEHDLFTSYGDQFYEESFSSFPSDDYWNEKEAFEREHAARRSGRVYEDCVKDRQEVAMDRCGREGLLPNGTKNVPLEECLRFWAEGMDDQAATAGRHTTSTRTWNEENNFETTGGVGGGGLKLEMKGGAKWQNGGAHSDAEIASTTRSRKGFAGSGEECMRRSIAHFDELRRLAAEAYAE